VTFEEFQKLRRCTSNVYDFMPSELTGAGSPSPGWLYEISDNVFVFIFAPTPEFDHTWTIIGNEQPVGTLEKLERILYDTFVKGDAS
jgi:hypothetical protein